MGRWSKKCIWANALIFVALLLIATTSLAHAQFDVSPPEFTTHPIPPAGADYKLVGENLVIRNRDTVTRYFKCYVVKPPENEVAEGFEPIPDNSWLFLVNGGLVVLEENSSKSIEMWVNIPRWENLLDKRWEAWIRVERMRTENEVVSVQTDVYAKIITASELGQLPSTSPLELPLLAAIILIVVAVAVAAWIGLRRRT